MTYGQTEILDDCRQLCDHERSAHGLGWEDSKRGRRIVANPFQPGTRRFEWYREGWFAFRTMIRTRNL